MSESLYSRLHSAAQGLLLPSEGDIPFTPFWLTSDSVTLNERRSVLASIRIAFQLPALSIHENRSLDDFFSPLIESGDDDEKRGFEALLNLFRDDLRDSAVYFLNTEESPEICYVAVIGFTAEGDLMGLTSYLIET